ncbi:hypothetical protein Pcinc_041460 [Petrolisthes cinctipes]|uniref:Uncharacterized protein n=1 Tax=Petrolisthes cinctipes TaxID=88211 RepID=A0AAE1EGX7_PETCI|nr:hypothetical protein Pcinc_041460 [Petrolisthes cinctipes]
MPETRHSIFKVVLLWWCWLVQIRANIQKLHLTEAPSTLSGNIGLGNTMKVRSKLQCCMAASVDTKAQYFCFKTPDVCTKYDVKVGAPHYPPSSSSSTDTQITCFSKTLSEFTSTPTEFTSTPTEFTSTPTEFTSTPTEFTSTPPEFTSTPTEFTSTPPEFTSTPTEFTSTPTEFTSTPTEFTSTP